MTKKLKRFLACTLVGNRRVMRVIHADDAIAAMREADLLDGPLDKPAPERTEFGYASRRGDWRSPERCVPCTKRDLTYLAKFLVENLAATYRADLDFAERYRAAEKEIAPLWPEDAGPWPLGSVHEPDIHSDSKIAKALRELMRRGVMPQQEFRAMYFGDNLDKYSTLPESVTRCAYLERKNLVNKRGLLLVWKAGTREDMIRRLSPKAQAAAEAFWERRFLAEDPEAEEWLRAARAVGREVRS